MKSGHNPPSDPRFTGETRGCVRRLLGLIWHSYGNLASRHRWPSSAGFVVESRVIFSSSPAVIAPSTRSEEKILSSPVRRNVILFIPPTDAWHAVRQVHPGTDQTRTSRHWQAHLPNDDKQGYDESCSSRVAHQDDRCGKDGSMGVGWRI